jgi:hypothetical protein
MVIWCRLVCGDGGSKGEHGFAWFVVEIGFDGIMNLNGKAEKVGDR